MLVILFLLVMAFNSQLRVIVRCLRTQQWQIDTILVQCSYRIFLSLVPVLIIHYVSVQLHATRMCILTKAGVTVVPPLSVGPEKM